MTDKNSKMVEFHKNNPLLSKVIIGSIGALNKITGKEAEMKKQDIAAKRARTQIYNVLGSTGSLNKSSTDLLISKAGSTDPVTREKIISKLKSDLKLKQGSMLSPGRSVMSPLSANSPKASPKASPKKSSSPKASPKKSSSPKVSSRIYAADEVLPVFRVKTAYL